MALAHGGVAQTLVLHHVGSGDFPGPHDTEWRRPLLHFSCLASVNRRGRVSKKGPFVPRCSGVLTGRSPQAIWGSPGKSWATLLSQNQRVYYIEEEEEEGGKKLLRRPVSWSKWICWETTKFVLYWQYCWLLTQIISTDKKLRSGKERNDKAKVLKITKKTPKTLNSCNKLINKILKNSVFFSHHYPASSYNWCYQQ